MHDAPPRRPTAVEYQRDILDAWMAIDPGTNRARLAPADRALLQRLHLQGVSPQLVLAAIRLAYLRRSYRSPHLEPLQPIRSLHYFLPVIHELADAPPDYLQALLHRPAPLQIPTLPDDR